MKPLKKFGQNYLTDKNIVNKLTESLKIEKNDVVLEIGPGKGFITDTLYKLTENLIAIEIDSRVIDELKDKYPKMMIIQNDFNKINISDLNVNLPLKIVGNIPFNQTGNILFKLIENIEFIGESSLIIPYDIAKRITAKSRTKEYGILAVLFNYFSNAKIVIKVSRNVFFPKPNMEAAIILIRFDKPLNKSIDQKLFIQVVKASFGNRRKTLYNSLRNSIFKDCDFSEMELPLNKRAEEFEAEDFIILTEYIQKRNA